MKRKKGEKTELQKRYIVARTQGKSMRESVRIAGYGNTNPCAIERPGGVVWQAIRTAIEKQGMSDDWLAEELRKSVDRADTAITRFNPKTGDCIQDPDLGAKDKLLGKIAKLKGYEREHTNPQVAIQINNNQAGGFEGVTDREAESLINAIRAEIGARESADVLEASVEDADSPAHNDVGGPGTEQ